MAKKLRFFPKSHLYKYGKQKLTSVTQFISSFFSEFDANAMAKVKARISRMNGEKGKGVKYWKALWEEKANHGSRVHKAIEEFITFGEVRTKYNEASDALKITHAIDYVKQHISYGTKTPEKVIFNESLGLAGTIDLMVVKKDGSVDLFDWKTNDKITLTGYKNKKAKFPITHLEDSSISKYSLQLSIYAYMLEQDGYVVNSLTLLHLTDDCVRPIKIDYMKDEVKLLMEVKNAKLLEQ